MHSCCTCNSQTCLPSSSATRNSFHRDECRSDGLGGMFKATIHDGSKQLRFQEEIFEAWPWKKVRNSTLFDFFLWDVGSKEPFLEDIFCCIKLVEKTLSLAYTAWSYPGSVCWCNLLPLPWTYTFRSIIRSQLTTLRIASEQNEKTELQYTSFYTRHGHDHAFKNGPGEGAFKRVVDSRGFTWFTRCTCCS